MYARMLLCISSGSGQHKFHFSWLKLWLYLIKLWEGEGNEGVRKSDF